MNDLFFNLQNNLSFYLKNHINNNFIINEVINAYNNMQESQSSIVSKILSLKNENDFKLLLSHWFSFSSLKLAFENKEYFFLLRKDLKNNTISAVHVVNKTIEDLLLQSINDNTLTKYILLSINEASSQKIMSNFLLSLSKN